MSDHGLATCSGCGRRGRLRASLQDRGVAFRERAKTLACFALSLGGSTARCVGSARETHSLLPLVLATRGRTPARSGRTAVAVSWRRAVGTCWPPRSDWPISATRWLIWASKPGVWVSLVGDPVPVGRGHSLFQHVCAKTGPRGEEARHHPFGARQRPACIRYRRAPSDQTSHRKPVADH